MAKAICHVYGQLDQTGDRTGEVLEHLARRDIPADISFNWRAEAATLARVRAWQRRGNLAAPNVYPGSVDRACTNSNWWAYSTAECVRLLKLARRRMQSQGFADFNAVNTYTPGNGFVAACKKLGIRHLLGFCAPTIINDGHWQITHAGAPLSPYFAGREDFRKPELPATENSLLISSMELRNPFTCRENWSEGPFCPLNLIMGDRTIEAGTMPVETMAMCEDFIRLSELTGVPRFFHINLQYFTSPKCFDLNARMLDWLADQRDQGRLVFTGLQGYADRLRAGGGLVPQATYWRGECMGQMVGGQPGNGNEALVLETMAGQWQFRRGAGGAEQFFDYTQRWNYAPFHPTGDEPKSQGYAAAVRVQAPRDRRRERDLVLQIKAPLARLVAVWDALENLAAPFRVTACENAAHAEVVPHPGGTGGVILVSDRRARGAVRLTITHGGRKTNNHSRRVRDLISVETAWIFGEPVTRLAPLVPAALDFNVAFSGGKRIRCEFIEGPRFGGRTLRAGASYRATLNGQHSTSMVRFWGVTADALEFDERELDAIQARLRAEASRLAAPGKSAGYLTCAPESACPAWIRRAASRGADADIQRVDAIVRKRFGQPRASYHMASDLPYGSKGRVRSTFYDRTARRGREAMFPLFYDYGQSYGPGITGWNQFLRINLGVRGLARGKRYRLVLHLFDPEQRNTRLRITAHATNAAGEGRKGPEVVLRDPFLVAQGIEARYNGDAFISVPLPAACRSGEAVDVGLHSHSEYRLYDRLTENFGFVFLAHAWLVERRPQAR